LTPPGDVWALERVTVGWFALIVRPAGHSGAQIWIACHFASLDIRVWGKREGEGDCEEKENRVHCNIINFNYIEFINF
jgi:hypothetical protein